MDHTEIEHGSSGLSDIQSWVLRKCYKQMFSLQDKQIKTYINIFLCKKDLLFKLYCIPLSLYEIKFTIWKENDSLLL